MVTKVYFNFNYNWLHIDKALGNFHKSDNKNRNVFIAWGPFPESKILQWQCWHQEWGLPVTKGLYSIYVLPVGSGTVLEHFGYKSVAKH